MLAAWKDTLQAAKDTRRVAEELHATNCRQHLHTAFAAWLHYSVDQQRYRMIIMTGLNSYATRLTRTAFLSWIHTVSAARYVNVHRCELDLVIT